MASSREKQTGPGHETWPANSSEQGHDIQGRARHDSANTDDDQRHQLGDGDDEHEPSILDRVVSRVTSQTSNYDPGPPPDGGLVAWTQCKLMHVSGWPQKRL